MGESSPVLDCIPLKSGRSFSLYPLLLKPCYWGRGTAHLFRGLLYVFGLAVVPGKKMLEGSTKGLDFLNYRLKKVHTFSFRGAMCKPFSEDSSHGSS